MSDGRPRRNRQLAALLVVLTATGLIVALAATRDSSTSSRREADPVTSSARAGAADRRYLTIGTTDGGQFTEAQLQEIADSYSVVVFAKFHGGWDVRLHHDAVRRLKAINPALEVYAYVSTKFWFDANRWDGAVIDPGWFLRDDTGEVVRVTKAAQDPESDELGTYVDVTNPMYRAWLLGVVQSWMAAAPYDGLRFDAADPIGDHGERDVRRWGELLSRERIDAYNAAIETLLATFSDALAPRRVLFNGISPDAIRGPGRDLHLLEVTAGAMDEDFCVRTDGELHHIEEDIGLMQTYAAERLHLRAPYPREVPNAAARARLSRVCVAAFLLGWVPGSTRFNMGTGYGTEQLDQQPPEIDLDLGQPMGPMHRDPGGVLRRDFERGEVMLNLDATPVEVELADGTARTVAPDDAIFAVDDTDGDTG